MAKQALINTIPIDPNDPTNPHFAVVLFKRPRYDIDTEQ
jgi:hypothetical protein